MRLRSHCVAAALIAFALFGVAGPVQAQARVEIVGAIGEIPDAPFETWTLFLVCNPDWATPDRSTDLARLYTRFRTFGDAIGAENLAVWFWTEETTLDDPRLNERVNVARSAEYCQALQLRPSLGPYLVVTRDYPRLDAFPADRAVFELGGRDPAAIATLLNALTDALLLEGRMDAIRGIVADVSTPAPASTDFWIRLLEGTRRTVIALGCAFRLRIDTQLFSAELRECAG